MSLLRRAHRQGARLPDSEGEGQSCPGKSPDLDLPEEKVCVPLLQKEVLREELSASQVAQDHEPALPAGGTKTFHKGIQERYREGIQRIRIHCMPVDESDRIRKARQTSSRALDRRIPRERRRREVPVHSDGSPAETDPRYPS